MGRSGKYSLKRKDKNVLFSTYFVIERIGEDIGNIGLRVKVRTWGILNLVVLALIRALGCVCAIVLVRPPLPPASCSGSPFCLGCLIGHMDHWTTYLPGRTQVVSRWNYAQLASSLLLTYLVVFLFTLEFFCTMFGAHTRAINFVAKKKPLVVEELTIVMWMYFARGSLDRKVR